MIKDTFSSGAIAGIIGVIAKTIIHFIFNFLWAKTYTYPDLIAMILLKTPESEIHQLFPFLLGLFIHILIGGILGIISIYTLKVVGREYLWFKGFIFGNLIYLIGPIFLLPLVFHKLSLDFLYISLLDHWIYGLVTIYSIVKLNPAIES